MIEVLKNCQYFKIYKQNKFHAQLSLGPIIDGSEAESSMKKVLSPQGLIRLCCLSGEIIYPKKGLVKTDQTAWLHRLILS